MRLTETDNEAGARANGQGHQAALGIPGHDRLPSPQPLYADAELAYRHAGGGTGIAEDGGRANPVRRYPE